MKLKTLDELLRRAFAPVDDEPTPGGGEQPDSASAVDVDDADPVVDDFLAQKPQADEPKGSEAPAQPAAQPPSPAPAPSEPQAPQPQAAPSPAPAPAAQPQAQPQAAAQPAPQPAQPQQPPVQPAAQPPAQPQAATPPVQPTQPPAQPPAQPTAEEQERIRQEQRTAYLARLEKDFAIAQEDQDALLAEPHTVLPKLAARVHVAAVETVVGLIKENLGSMVMAVLEQQKAAQSAEQEFYSAWPKLNTPEAKQEAARLMQAYISTNKGVSREQAIKDVGLLVHASLRIPLDVPGAPPAAPAASAPVIPPPAPAQPGSSGGVAVARQPTVWDKVDSELFSDD